MKTYIGFLNKTNMPENGIFVFGSNMVCINGNPSKGTGGAALVAHKEFGVELRENMANKLSKSGKAWGIVTVNAPKRYISEGSIINNIKIMYEFAKKNKKNLFFIAYDGINPEAVSLNGKTRKVMAKLFYLAGEIPENIVFELHFSNLVKSNFKN